MCKEGNRAGPERRPLRAGLSLLEALADVPDPRSRHGRVRPLPAILALTVLALSRGGQGPAALAPFGRDHGTPLAHALGQTPAASCLSQLYSRLDPVAFETARARWIQPRTPAASAGSRRRRGSGTPRRRPRPGGRRCGPWCGAKERLRTSLPISPGVTGRDEGASSAARTRWAASRLPSWSVRRLLVREVSLVMWVRG